METRTNRIWLVMMVLLLGLVGASWAEDPNLGTVFSYQGRLETAGSGDPLSGSYDFKFRVYADAVSTNTAIGDPMEVPNVPVTKGIFTVRTRTGRRRTSSTARSATWRSPSAVKTIPTTLPSIRGRGSMPRLTPSPPRPPGGCEDGLVPKRWCTWTMWVTSASAQRILPRNWR